MATEEMNVDERFKYLRIMQGRYVKANRAGKAALLTEMQANTDLHRKYLIARMNSPDIRRRRRRERDRSCGPDLEHAVGVVADALDWIGAERLQPCLAGTALNLARHGHLALTAALRSRLETISIGTARRIVRTQDRAATPLERLLRAKPPLSRATAEHLPTLCRDTDLLNLKRRIHHQLGELAKLARRDEGRETITFR